MTSYKVERHSHYYLVIATAQNKSIAVKNATKAVKYLDKIMRGKNELEISKNQYNYIYEMVREWENENR